MSPSAGSRSVPARVAALLLVLGLLSCGPERAPTTAGSGPAANLLLITLDTTRADHLSAYGGTQAEVPNLDRLARAGVRFDLAFAPTPITLPSHASLLTGLYPTAHGVRNNGTFRLEDEAFTLAEALTATGVHTAAVIGSQILSSRYGLDQGFDLYDDALPPPETVKTLYVERRAAEVADRALGWLGARDSERWFLWLHFFDPHWEYAPPEPFRTRYADSPYDGEIAYVDQELGRVLDYLRDRGWLDRTAIIVAGDHGESLGEHGESSHGLFVYDATMRVPLLMRHPGTLPAGRQVDSLVRLVDVFPTALELLGVPYDAGAVHGKSLLPLAAGEAEDARTAWLESWPPRLNYGWSELSAVRDRDWKYIRAPRPELYALGPDPGEEDDQATVDPERVEEYRARLEQIEAAITPGAGGSLSSEQEPDYRTRRALESLGYVSSGVEETEGDDRADPKDKVEEYERVMRAVELVAQSRFSEAIPVLQQLVLDNPMSSYRHRHLAGALLGAGRTQEGIQELERGVELNPADFDTLTSLGSAFFGIGDLAKAEASFRGALAMNPHVAVAYHNLGLIAQQRGRPEQAIPMYERALEEDPALGRRVAALSPDRGARSGERARLVQRCLPSRAGGAARGGAGAPCGGREGPSDLAPSAPVPGSGLPEPWGPRRGRARAAGRPGAGPRQRRGAAGARLPGPVVLPVHPSVRRRASSSVRDGTG